MRLRAALCVAVKRLLTCAASSSEAAAAEGASVAHNGLVRACVVVEAGESIRYVKPEHIFAAGVDNVEAVVFAGGCLASERLVVSC